jgi:hypothetical protein
MLSLLGMSSTAANGNALSAALAPSQAPSTVGSGQGCPAGQRSAAQHECMAAVLSVAFDEKLELHSARGLKVVNDGAEGAIPPGCSYSFTSTTAVFNTNVDKAAGFGSSYQVGPRSPSPRPGSNGHPDLRSNLSPLPKPSS